MNIKSYTLTILMVAFALSCKAQSITQEAARQKAMAFMKQMGMPVAHGMRRAPVAHQSSASAPYYVFNATETRGFVIVSGDERTEEILGYSTESPFDEESLPEAAKTWLKEYADQLEAVRQGTLKASPLRVKSHKAIEKLVTSVWSQGETTAEGNAFNQDCPTIGGQHCSTGCVATAMAQVMRYNKWPNTLTSEIPSYKPNDNISTLDKLPRTKFDWGKMLDKYDEGQSAASCAAVAHLMRYCGQAVEMDYGIGSSSASTSDAAMALRTYFGYDINTRFEERSDYTIESWDELIYNELSERRPVVYRGSNMGGGHAFVCDGYDGNGFYHINWGWSGHFNGYFKLAILNPKGGETGSSTSNCGYSINQGAIVGIQPPCGFNDDMRMLTLKDFYREDHVIAAQFSNHTGLPGNFEYGFAYQKINTGSNNYQISKLTNYFEPFHMRTVTADLDTWTLSDGTYHFYPYNILEGSGWYHVSGDFQKYVEVVVSGGKVTKMTMHPRSSLTINSLTCKGNQIVNMPQEVVLKVSNKSEEYNKYFYLFASKTNVKGEPVDQVCLPVEAGGQAESSLYFTPNSTGKWKIWVDIN